MRQITMQHFTMQHFTIVTNYSNTQYGREGPSSEGLGAAGVSFKGIERGCLIQNFSDPPLVLSLLITPLIGNVFITVQHLSYSYFLFFIFSVIICHYAHIL
jgi:hypothetical protein